MGHLVKDCHDRDQEMGSDNSNKIGPWMRASAVRIRQNLSNEQGNWRKHDSMIFKPTQTEKGSQSAANSTNQTRNRTLSWDVRDDCTVKKGEGNVTNKVSIPLSINPINALAAILESLAGWHLTPKNDQKVNQEFDPISQQSTVCYNQPVEFSKPKKSKVASEGECQALQVFEVPVRAKNKEVEAISMKGAREELGGKERKWKMV